MLDPRQGVAESLCALLMQALLQSSRVKTRLEDPLHREAVVGVVPHSMRQRLVDVVAVVSVLLKQDVPGVVTAVAREALLQTFQKIFARLPQREKGLAHRLQTVAYLLGIDPMFGKLPRLVG